MMKTFAVCAVSICAVVTLSLPVAYAQETSVPLNQIPVWVLNAAKAAANQTFGPSAVIVSAQTDPEGDFLTYEFTGAAPGILGFEIDVLPDGKVEEIEQVIPASMVPTDVLARLTTFFPNFQPTTVEKSTRAAANGLTAVWTVCSKSLPCIVVARLPGSNPACVRPWAALLVHSTSSRVTTPRCLFEQGVRAGRAAASRTSMGRVIELADSLISFRRHFHNLLPWSG
jgi:hypothetical protein